MIPFTGGTQSSQNHGGKVQWWFVMGWGEGTMGSHCLIGIVLILQDENSNGVR